MHFTDFSASPPLLREISILRSEDALYCDAQEGGGTDSDDDEHVSHYMKGGAYWDDESDDDAVPLASRSVDELKAICRRRNLRVGGKKAELVQRIVDDDGGVREPSKKKRRVRKRNWGRGSMSGQQLGAMASAMRVVLPEQLPTPALVSREAPAQRQDHVCTCLSGHPDRCAAPVHICACCAGPCGNHAIDATLSL